MQRFFVVLTALWLGAQMFAGYVAAPVFFAQLPVQEAGDLAGRLFARIEYAGLAVWVVTALFVRYWQEYRFIRSYTPVLLWVMSLLLLAECRLVTPVIAALKAGTGNWLLSLLGGSFALWHSVSVVLYLCVSLLGLYLVFKLAGMKGRR